MKHLTSWMHGRIIKKTVYVAGNIGVYLFAFGALGSTAIAAIAVGIVWAAFIVEIIRYPGLARDKFVVVSILFVFYVLLRTVLLVIQMPGITDVGINSGTEYLRLGFMFIVPIGYWIAKSSSKIHFLLLLFVAGLMTRIAFNTDIDNLNKMLVDRPGFGLPANHFGLYASVALLTVCVYAKRFWGSKQNRILFMVRFALWAILMIVFIVGINAASSRSALLAMVLMAPLLLFLIIHRHVSKNARGIRSLLPILAASMLFITVVIWANADIIKEGVVQKWTTISSVISGHGSEVEVDIKNISIMVRYDTWRFGKNKWLERPYLGWGPGSSRYLLKHSEAAIIRFHAKIISPIVHFHNFYIQLLVELGLVGALFYAILFYLVLLTLWRAYQQGWCNFNSFLVTLGAIGLFALANNFNPLADNAAGRQFVGLFGGIASAYRFTSLPMNRNAET